MQAPLLISKEQAQEVRRIYLSEPECSLTLISSTHRSFRLCLAIRCFPFFDTHLYSIRALRCNLRRYSHPASYWREHCVFQQPRRPACTHPLSEEHWLDSFQLALLSFNNPIVAFGNLSQLSMQLHCFFSRQLALTWLARGQLLHLGRHLLWLLWLQLVQRRSKLSWQLSKHRWFIALAHRSWRQAYPK